MFRANLKSLLSGLTLIMLSQVSFGNELDVVNKAGSLAAGANDVAAGTATELDIREKFTPLGEEILLAALAWSKDEELAGAPPAFRRFLYFEYLTDGNSVTAGASVNGQQN